LWRLWRASHLSSNAAAAQANVSPERPTKERELQTQLVSKESEIRRLNERLLSMSEQAAGTSRLLSDLQQEKDRVQELMSEVLELRRQLRQQQDEMKTQNVQVCAISITIKHTECRQFLATSRCVWVQVICCFRPVLVCWSCSRSCKL
jgi:chromosome segregation ATPase